MQTYFNCKNPQHRLMFTLSFILVILFFGIDFSIEFATDTYATFMDHTVWKYMLFENGRIINAFIYWLFYHFSVAPKIVYTISYLSAITFAILSVYLYSMLLNSILDNAYLSTFIAFFSLLNPFSIEYFLYIEKGLFLFAIFSAVNAVIFLQNYFDSGNIFSLLFVFLCLIITVCCYQICIGMFVICAIPILIKNNASIKDFIFKNIIAALLYGGGLGFSYLTTNVFLHSSRVGHSNAFLNILKDTCIWIITITKDSFYHLPNNYLLQCYLVVILFILFLFLQSTNKKIYILSVIYSFFVVLIVAFFPFFSGVTSDYACRTVYPYGSIFGILVTVALQLSTSRKNKQVIRIFSILAILLMFTQYILFQNVFLDRYKGNQVDKYICQMIGERIRDYETNTENTVSTICFYKDQSLTWGIDGAFQNGLLDRAHATGWSNLASINYYLDKQYIKSEPQEYYINYFQSKNWNFYSDEQLIFEGDTLHFCVY